MSAVAIVSVAAVCAGYLWLERHQVRRAARARFLERRRQGALRWCEPGFSSECPAARALESSIDDAVRCADVAWSYYDRLFLAGSPGESPFQLRRGRVDTAQRRFAEATARLEAAAADWLAVCEHDSAVGAQSKIAVQRMQAWLAEHPVPDRFPVGEGAGSVRTAVDVLENALANLRQRRVDGARTDPFRHVAGAGASRQDVTRTALRVPARHGSPASYSPTP